MSGLLRSKRGCWTCRLRKKRCDESRPHCSTCESLSITCYGFGPKPEWMDDAVKKRQVANNIKDIVKRTSRHKGATQSSSKREVPVRLAPKPSSSPRTGSSSETPSSSQHQTDSTDDPTFSRDYEYGSLQDESAHSSSSQEGQHEESDSISTISSGDAILLMHFLDHVFPLQYPMYKPSIAEGGRGWLLSLLFETKPLYHAALALSAFHRRVFMKTSSIGVYRVSTLSQEEDHLEICLKLVRQSAQFSCQNYPLGIAASVVQLIFFELFTGNGNAWQAHLKVAVKMYKQTHLQGLRNLHLGKESRQILRNETFPLQLNAKVTEEVSSFAFLRGTILWLDIVFSITAGTTPNLSPYHAQTIGPRSQTHLEDIMGCQSWVMVRIGSIAALHEQKCQALLQGLFDCGKFGQAACVVSRQLQEELAQSALEYLRIADTRAGPAADTKTDTLRLVSHIFAKMALVYLHLVVYGYTNLELVGPYIDETVQIVQNPSTQHILPALVCPLFIIGSTVNQHNEDIFRKVFSSLPILDRCLQHRAGMLPILEEIWDRRKTRSKFLWADSLELTHSLLLL